MTESNQNSVQDILIKIEGLSPVEALKLLSEEFNGVTVFSTSFSFEDQVITDMIRANQLAIEIFTLDTGRMFPETYSTWTRTLEKYPAKITAYYPDALCNIHSEGGRRFR